MRYGAVPKTATDDRHCMPSIKDMKARLKDQKNLTEDFIELTRKVDMNWELRQQTIGSMYLEIRAIKEEIHRLKQLKKTKVKKGK